MKEGASIPFCCCAKQASHLASGQLIGDVNSCQPEAVGRGLHLQRRSDRLEKQGQPGLVHLQCCPGLWRHLRTQMSSVMQLILCCHSHSPICACPKQALALHEICITAMTHLTSYEVLMGRVSPRTGAKGAVCKRAVKFERGLTEAAKLRLPGCRVLRVQGCRLVSCLPGDSHQSRPDLHAVQRAPSEGLPGHCW